MCAPIDRVRREELTADRVEHVPIPPAAPTTPSALPARPGCRRAAAGVGRRVRGARAYRGARGGI